MQPKNVSNKRILISVLNWGMGHVSRSIGLINQLISQENDIFIACDENQKNIFKEYFPTENYISHDGYPFHFSGKGNFALDLLKSSKGLSSRMKMEYSQVAKYIEEHQINLVLSDHRYGFRSDKVPSIFITHQLNLPVKWYQSMIQKRHVKLMKRFSEVWILDYSDNRLAGKLSKKIEGVNASYVGPYSRFMLYDLKEKDTDSILITSGPLVYAQQFLNEQLKNELKKKFKVIAPPETTIAEEIQRLSNNWKTQDKELLTCKKIISRSGYSSVMDVHFLQCEFQFYPTKGQAEQEYLDYLHKKKTLL